MFPGNVVFSNYEGGRKPGSDPNDVKEAYIKGEVVRREKSKAAQLEELKVLREKMPVPLDRTEVYAKKPKDRARWFARVVEQAATGSEVDMHTFFEIISAKSFGNGLTPRMGRTMTDAFAKRRSIFSGRQAQHLASEKWEPARLAQEADDDDERKQDEEERRERKRADEPPTKKKKKHKGIERRLDPADQNMYTIDEFCAEYGGSAAEPPEQWKEAASTRFIFKS